jgi:predicted transcriptional regulator
MKTKNSSPQEQGQLIRRNEQKWSKPLMEARWTALPSVILERQQALGLDAVDVNILFHLARFWWFAENHPHPAKATIAACMGIHPSTVRRRIARMEADGLITRKQRFHAATGGQQSNFYRFDGLIKHATPFALEAIQERTRKRTENNERLRRKRPKLRVLEGGRDD